MLPFDTYPHKGRQLLGVARGANSRHEYCHTLMQLTGQRCCAYCDAGLTATYQVWLTLVADHVIPTSVCKLAGIPEIWYEDYSNLVLACAACNGFCNRYRPTFSVVPPDTLEAFYELRDKVFAERRKLIIAKHEEERQFFNGRSWELPVSKNE